MPPTGRVALLALLCLLTLGCATPVLAHAALLSSAPSSGDVLEAPPEEIVLTFSEPVAPTAMRLATPTGQIEDLAADTSTGNQIVIELPHLLQGTHLFSWRTVSLDGHPISGTLTFSNGVETAAALPGLATDELVRSSTWIARVALYIGLFVGAAGAFFFAWVAPAPPPAKAVSVIQACIAVGGVAAILALGLQGLDLLGLPLSELGIVETWQVAGMSTYAHTIVAALVALLMGLLGFNRVRWIARIGSAGALLGVGVAFALSGHASRAAPEYLSWFVVFIHAVTIAFWVGSLVPLFFVMGRSDQWSLAALNRFSRAIPWAIAPLLVSGGLLIVIQLDTPADLWTTDYGWILLAKLSAVMGLFVLAIVNRYRLTPMAQVDLAAGARHLQRLIAAELILVFVVFGIVAIWRFTPPSRAVIAVGEPAATTAASIVPVQVAMNGDGLTAHVTITSGETDGRDVALHLMDEGGLSYPAMEVSVVLSNPAAGIESTRRTAVRIEDGSWLAQGFTIPAPGTWALHVEVLISDFEQIILRDEIELGWENSPNVPSPTMGQNGNRIMERGANQ